MGITREESLSRFGTDKYTAWDLPGANQDALAKGINVMQTKPNPAQLTSGTNTAQATKQPFKKIAGFSNLQNQYAEAAYNQPNYQDLYSQYSQQTGLADVKKLVTDLDTSVADIEDKIAQVEPNINKEVGNYLINESQRGRMVTAGEQPLRTQYADILRSRSRLSAEATAKAELVNTLMSYAKENYTGKVDYLKTLADIEKSNKTSSTGSYTQYLNKETKPSSKGGIDSIFSDVKIDEGGNVKTEAKPSSKVTLDKTGNLVLGGGMKLNSNKKDNSLLYLAGR